MISSGKVRSVEVKFRFINGSEVQQMGRKTPVSGLLSFMLGESSCIADGRMIASEILAKGTHHYILQRKLRQNL